MPTRQACPRLPTLFHSYMQKKHGDWSDVNVHSGWSCEKLLQGMLEFSGYKYKASTIIASDCTRKDCSVLEYKYRYKEFKKSTKNPFSLEWLTQKCSMHKAGLFSFWKNYEQLGHAVALTMCNGSTYGLDWLDMTTLSSLVLILYRRRIGRTGNDEMSDKV